MKDAISRPYSQTAGAKRCRGHTTIGEKMKIQSVGLNPHVPPHGALNVHLSDGTNSISVQVKLEPHHNAHSMTIQEIEDLAKHAAKHLIP